MRDEEIEGWLPWHGWGQGECDGGTMRRGGFWETRTMETK